MNYRTLGKSGIRVSEVGIGGHQETVHLDDSPGHAGLWSTNFDGLVPVMAHEDRTARWDIGCRRRRPSRDQNR